MTAHHWQRPPVGEALTHPFRSLNTVRYLRPGQLVNRVTRYLCPLGALPQIDDASILLPRSPSAPAEVRTDAFDGHSFCFLNQRAPFAGTDRWHPAAADDLWVYNLHYFQYLWGLDPATALGLMHDWMATNTDPRAAAWHAYPISLRVREWIEWLLAHPDISEISRQRVARSIVQQTEALRRQLEFHLMGNHLLENAITLCWAGLSFGGPRAQAWLGEGAALLRREAASQVLADGTHDERSPMYQALLTDAMLRLAEVAAQAPCAGATAIRDLAAATGRRMLAALARLVHPDGEYALLNDAALRVAPSLAGLERRFGPVLADPGPHRMWALQAAGYLGYRCGRDNGHYLVFDAGPIGPDHQPGHGHADTLSFELSHRGRRLVTDTGVFAYRVGAARRYDRSTAAHNTIEIDGRDQSECWGSFRCARRPGVHTAIAEQGRDSTTLVGGYVGPGRGLSSVGHTRRIVASGDALAFTDSVVASGEHQATLRLHFAPGLRVRKAHRGWIVEDGPGRSRASVVGDGLEWVESSSPHHPEFGVERERPSLAARISFRDRLTLKWWVILN